MIIQHKCCYRSWRTLEQTSSSQDPRTPRPGYRACPDWTRPVNQSEVSITRESSNQVSVLPCLDLGGTQGLGMPLTWSCYGAPGGCGNLAMIIFMKVQCLMIVLKALEWIMNVYLAANIEIYWTLQTRKTETKYGTFHILEKKYRDIQ